MSAALLITLTVIEIVLLVLVLALYLVALTRRLHDIVAILGKVSEELGWIQGGVALVGAGATILNRKLETIEGALPPIAVKAESLG